MSHIISRKKIRDFVKDHPEAFASLDAWYRRAKKAKWKSFHDLRSEFGSADLYANFVIFDVGGNKYRLIAEVNYRNGKLLIRHILTHADYSRGKWKKQ
jgi:mRNA interferase HigB